MQQTGFVIVQRVYCATTILKIFGTPRQFSAILFKRLHFGKICKENSMRVVMPVKREAWLGLKIKCDVWFAPKNKCEVWFEN